MHQPTTMLSPFPAHFPSANITTEQIQNFLDENKKLILAILDNQNFGKLADCAQYQAKLQQNLMYLAAIADAQPPTVSVPPQMPPHAAMQPGGLYMQHPQFAAVQPQMFMAFGPDASNGLHALHTEGVTNSLSDGRGNTSVGGLRNPFSGSGAANGETSFARVSEKGGK